MAFDLESFRKTAEIFDPMAEDDRSEFDAEVQEAEKALSFEQMLERQEAQKLHGKALYSGKELTLEQKQLLVKWDLATFSGDTETEFGKFELRKNI